MNIAIVGAHSANKLDAPYGDKDWDIWSLSPKNENELPRVDLWFEMHKRFLTNPDADGKEYGDWLRLRHSLIMLAETPLLPQATAYRKDEATARFGEWFFNSSLSWMLAQAIMEKPKVIGLWGVESSAGEYAAQRPSILFFAQVAKMQGIEPIAPGSRLLDPEMLYGYDHLV